MGGQMILMGKSRNLIERDSLNSYNVEDDYYEGDEDEVFEEIEYIQSPAEQFPPPNDQQHQQHQQMTGKR